MWLILSSAIALAVVGLPATGEQDQRQLQALQALVEQMAVALPAEPVGVGARWRTREVLQAGAPPTELEVDDFSGKVKALDLQARQVLVLDLDRPLPVSRATQTQLHLELSGWKGILPVKLTMDLQQEQTLRSP